MSTQPTSTPATLTVPLWRAAHGRTGDKGNHSNISVIAWHPRLYEPLVAQLAPERVAARFAHRRPSAVERYELPRLTALNFVLRDALDGGVNDALGLDSHGKSLAFWLLDLTVELPAALEPLLRGSDAP